jgi:hypothetical protein
VSKPQTTIGTRLSFGHQAPAWRRLKAVVATRYTRRREGNESFPRGNPNRGPRKVTGMRDAIVQKLSVILTQAPRNESEVVYAFVEIRKLLEREYPKRREFEVLTFFCDWVAHIKLDRKGAQRMLAVLDAELRPSGEPVPEHVPPTSALYQFISLEPLYDEIGRFCKHFQFPGRWTDPAVWKECMRLYGQVVRDCPLAIRGQGTTARYISELRLIDTRDCDEPPDKRCFSWCWQFTLSDTKEFRMTSTYSYPSVSRDPSRPSPQEFGI